MQSHPFRRICTCVRTFTPQFVARKSGTIAKVSSVVGLSAVQSMAGYSASKAAVHSLTQSLRGTLEKDNITVIGIYPRPIETDLAKPVPYPKKGNARIRRRQYREEYG